MKTRGKRFSRSSIFSGSNSLLYLEDQSKNRLNSPKPSGKLTLSINSSLEELNGDRDVKPEKNKV